MANEFLRFIKKSRNMHTTNINVMYAAALVRSRFSGAVAVLALFAFPQTVTLQGTTESRKVSHFRLHGVLH